MALAVTAVLVSTLVCVHLLSRLASWLGRDNHYNHNIRLWGGMPVGEGYMDEKLLVQYGGEEDTVVRGMPRESVTSDFRYLYVRLYREDTGEYQDCCMEDKLIIGRWSQDAWEEGIWLNDAMVSRHHCLLFRKGDQMMLQDMDSTNHTYVNGFQIDGAVPINNGDRIGLGSGVYRFWCCCTWEEGETGQRGRRKK